MSPAPFPLSSVIQSVVIANDNSDRFAYSTEVLLSPPETSRMLASTLLLLSYSTPAVNYFRW